MTGKRRLLTFILSMVIFVLVFWVSSRLFFRLDFTNGKIYTLSQTSRNLFLQIDDIVRVTYFVSDRLISSHPLPREIIGLLNEYTAFSKGKIQFSAKDPARSGLTDEIESLGIFPQSVRLIENNEIIVTEVYTGITIEYRDRIEILPVVFSVVTLEYDVTSRIISMVQDKKKELGIIIGGNSGQWPADFTLLDSELRRSGYTIRLLSPYDEIPQRLPALFVIGGAEELDEPVLSRIDGYIRNGGNALFAQDGLFVDLQNGMEIRQIRDRGLLALIASYGAAILPALAMDRSSLQISFQDRNDEVRTIPYPLWISVQDQDINRNNPITADLHAVNLYWASPIELAPPPGVKAEILLSSSDESWLQTSDYSADPMAVLDPGNFGPAASRTKGRRNLGVTLSGSMGSGGSAGTSRIIVIGDSDFAGSMMEIGGGEAGNLDFLSRAADWLVNDDLPIGLRRVNTGHLDRISETGKRKAAMDFSRNLNVFVIPAMFLLTGIIVTAYRRKKTGGPFGDDRPGA